jgi:uncharacterized protein
MKTGKTRGVVAVAVKTSDKHIAAKLTKLVGFIKRYESAAVAYSGGVDSSLVAYITDKVIPKTLCIIEDSPAMTGDELSAALGFCRRFRIKYRVIKGRQLEDPDYLKNDRNRCYHCKRMLFADIEKIRKREKLEVIFDGSNHDDRGDYRPGRTAQAEYKVKSPLMECGFSKSDVRKLSRLLGLPTWDKPQMACMASRIPYGTAISAPLLERVGSLERAVKSLGYKTVRARLHGDILRLEIGSGEKIDLEGLRRILPQLKMHGFKYVTLDIEGYRTGSMNAQE